jgi:hypothetical protein
MAKRGPTKWFTQNIPEEVSDSSIFRFSVTIGKQTVELDMRSDLDIDYTIIQQQLEDTPSEFAFWAAIYSELKLRVSAKERQLKSCRGKIADEIMKECLKHSTKATDKQVTTAIEADQRIVVLESELMLLEKQAGKLYYMVEAIKMKAENLRSLSGFAKIEFGQAK